MRNNIKTWQQTEQTWYVRQFSGSKVTCMKDYIMASVRGNKSDRIIYHVVTNDVRPEKTPQSTAKLAKSATNDNLQVTVSSIVPENDQ